MRKARKGVFGFRWIGDSKLQNKSTGINMPSRPNVLSPSDIRIDDRYILFYDGSVIVKGAKYVWELGDLDPTALVEGALILVEDTEEGLIAVDLQSDLSTDLTASLVSVRTLLRTEPELVLRTAGRANQLVEWYQQHQYCGKCGEKTTPRSTERALECVPCNRHYFPRINPCVIVLVKRNEEVLLAKSARFNSDFYSCLAGFIEVGETPEETVEREVYEEVGLLVKSVRYVFSQSWPFPSQLMLGFIAEYKSGELALQADEIAEAAWYKLDQLPNIPSAAVSVAGRLIEYVNQNK